MSAAVPELIVIRRVNENSLAIRTDFSDAAAWDQVRAMIEQPVGEFRAYVDFVSDPEFDGLTPERLLSSLPEASQKPFAFFDALVTKRQ